MKQVKQQDFIKYSVESLNQFTVKEIIALFKEYGFKGYSRLKKADLIKYFLECFEDYFGTIDSPEIIEVEQKERIYPKVHYKSQENYSIETIKIVQKDLIAVETNKIFRSYQDFIFKDTSIEEYFNWEYLTQDYIYDPHIAKNKYAKLFNFNVEIKHMTHLIENARFISYYPVKFSKNYKYAIVELSYSFIIEIANCDYVNLFYLTDLDKKLEAFKRYQDLKAEQDQAELESLNNSREIEYTSSYDISHATCFN